MKALLTGVDWTHWGPDNLEQRLEGAAELHQLAKASGNDDLALPASWAHICDLLELGDLKAADAELDSYERLALKRRAPYHMFGAACWRAMRAISDGRLEDADGLAKDAFDLGRRVLPHRFLPFHGFATQRYVIRRDQGRLGEHLQTTRELADRLSDFPAWRAALAALYAELGCEAEARTEFETLGSARLRRSAPGPPVAGMHRLAGGCLRLPGGSASCRRPL